MDWWKVDRLESKLDFHLGQCDIKFKQVDFCISEIKKNLHDLVEKEVNKILEEREK